MKLSDWLESEPGPDEPPPERTPSSPLERRLDELRHLPVIEVMTARPLIRALDADVQLRRVRNLKSNPLPYLLVYRGDLDQILGWISKRRALELLNLASDEVDLAAHVEPVGRIAENSTVGQLADYFLSAKTPLLVVVDGAGNTRGTVELDTLTEHLFGFASVQNSRVDSTRPRDFDL